MAARRRGCTTLGKRNLRRFLPARRYKCFLYIISLERFLKPYRRASPEVTGLIETMQKAKVPSNVFVDRGFSEDFGRAVNRRLRAVE